MEFHIGQHVYFKGMGDIPKEELETFLDKFFDESYESLKQLKFAEII